jgi:hypothetical protein
MLIFCTTSGPENKKLRIIIFTELDFTALSLLKVLTLNLIDYPPPKLEHLEHATKQHL